MSDSPDPAQDTPATPSGNGAGSGNTGCWRAFMVLGVVFIVAATVVAFFFADAARQFLDKFTGGSFMTTKTTLKTEEILLEMRRTHGDELAVASPMIMMETFSKADVRFAAWGWVYMGTATSEIKVPATYRFHIKLSEIKQARIDDNVLVVTAPVIHPTLPVAFDTAKMEKKMDDTWLRFDAAQQLADLEKTVTPALAARAKAHVNTVRENARKDIEEFVQKWIVETHPDYRDQIKAVKVIFPGEDARTTEKSTTVP